MAAMIGITGDAGRSTRKYLVYVSPYVCLSSRTRAVEASNDGESLVMFALEGVWARRR